MLDSVQESELFAGISQHVIDEIANSSIQVAFEEGATIFTTGEKARYVYELMDGSVDIILLEQDIIHLTASRTGQIFGWSALVEPYVYTATAKCAEPTKAIRISRDLIEEVSEKHPAEGLKILQHLTGIIAHRLRLAYAYIHYLSGTTIDTSQGKE